MFDYNDFDPEEPGEQPLDPGQICATLAVILTSCS